MTTISVMTPYAIVGIYVFVLFNKLEDCVCATQIVIAT